MNIFGPYKKSNRSASMQLSINAIVILVMAMAVLGLGLGIIKGIKAKSDSFLDFKVDLSQPASASQRLTEVKDWSFKANTETQIGVGFYNTDLNCETYGAKVDFKCDNFKRIDDEEVTEEDFKLKQPLTPVNVGDSGILKLRITPSKELVRDSYACSFQVKCALDETGDIEGVVAVESYPVFLTITA